MGEVKVTADFLNNYAGDNVRRLAKVRRPSASYFENPRNITCHLNLYILCRRLFLFLVVWCPW